MLWSLAQAIDIWFDFFRSWFLICLTGWKSDWNHVARRVQLKVVKRGIFADRHNSFRSSIVRINLKLFLQKLVNLGILVALQVQKLELPLPFFVLGLTPLSHLSCQCLFRSTTLHNSFRYSLPHLKLEEVLNFC